MVNNNGIPIEINKKPVETVYEIKDEYKVPSFEEFMKDYQANENLNYDDLSGGDIGEVKGYGPCRRYNTYCNCSYGERWVDLKIACPAVGCTNPNDTPSYWVHASDWERVEISNKARIQCTKYGGCGYASHMAYWDFKCSDHRGSHDYKETSEQLAIKAILMANQLKAMDRALAVELVNYLTANEWPKR